MLAVLSVLRLVRENRTERSGRLDVMGPTAITLAPLALINALLRSPSGGWTSASTLLLLGAAVTLFVAFLVIERRHPDPLVPLGFFADRTRASANALNLVMFSTLLATFFCMSLYMQHVLGYSPITTGLAYLPFGIALGAALGISNALIPRVGVRPVIVAGLLIGAAGMVIFSRAPENGSLSVQVLGVKPGLVVNGLGRSRRGGVGLVGGAGRARADAQPYLGPRSGVVPDRRHDG